MVFNVAKIASARASLAISLTKSLRVAGPLIVAVEYASGRFPLCSQRGVEHNNISLRRSGQHSFCIRHNGEQR